MSKLSDYRARLRASATMFLGAAAVLIVGAASPALAGGTPYEVVYSFTGQGGDGANPGANVIADAAGNLYGTTYSGGQNGAGTVYKIAPNGTETVLYSFTGTGADGANPAYGNLLLDGAGNLYGTTMEGTATGGGAVFKIAPDGTETTLHGFGNGNDAKYSQAGLVSDEKGNLYGTTSGGGANYDGAVFEIKPDGTETVIYSFTGGVDGFQPYATLNRIGHKLYGTTSGGGTYSNGAVFELASGKTGAWTETTLYSFTGGTDGGYPYGSLINDKAGNFYSTTSVGGANGYGNVFKLAPDGTQTVLYSFAGGNDGATPLAGVYLNKKGYFYGLTFGGGADADGTVFQLAPNGTETVLHTFTGGNDGTLPSGSDPLVKVGNYLYGTTWGGGANGNGTVFRIKK